MMLWLRVRRMRACIATILAVVVVLLLAGDLSLPLPNLLGGPQFAVRLALLLPIAVAIVIAWGLAAGDPLVEAVASRPLYLLDVAFALGVALLTLAACALAWRISGTDLALAAGRNALGYVGLALIGRRVLGSHAAAVMPGGFAIATALFGSAAGGQPRWWAWLLAAADEPLAWSCAVVLLLLGAAVALLHTDVTATEH